MNDLKVLFGAIVKGAYMSNSGITTPLTGSRENVELLKEVAEELADEYPNTILVQMPYSPYIDFWINFQPGHSKVARLTYRII